MKARVLDENGKEQTMVMGCYGIGVSRVVAPPLNKITMKKASFGLRL